LETFLATILGSLPGTVSLVLFGTSIGGNFTDGVPDLNPWTLMASVLIAAGSLVLSRQLKRPKKTSRSASRRGV